jgi:hypothetical protein
MLFFHDLDDLFEWLFVVDPILLDGLLVLLPDGAHGDLFRMYDLQLRKRDSECIEKRTRRQDIGAYYTDKAEAEMQGKHDFYWLIPEPSAVKYVALRQKA